MEINFCPRCAHPLEDRALFGRVRRACPSCRYIFFIDPKVACGALIERGAAVLLIRRAVDPKKGYWALPAGFMEADEGPIAATMRECREETGLTIRVTGLFGVYTLSGDPDKKGVIVLYRAVPESGKEMPGDDASEVRFFKSNELPQNLAFASTRRVLFRWCVEQADR